MTDKREEGISYFYVFPDAHDDVDVDKAQQKGPVFVGRKRYAGLYCRTCETVLGFTQEKSTKLSKQMRSAEKNDDTIVQKCTKCGATSSQTVVPCCSFDWQVPPHTLLAFTKSAPRSTKAAQAKHSAGGGDDDDDDDDDDDNANEKSVSEQKKTYKAALTHIKQQENSNTRRLSPPRLERGGVIETQYGTRYSLQDFWTYVVDPCPVQHYDQIIKDHVA